MKVKNTRNYVHEIVPMPNKDFLVNTFYYRQDSCGIIMPIHWHENIEFIHVESGKIKVSSNSSTFIAGPGDNIVVNSGEYHGYECISAPMSLYCVVADMFVFNSRLFDACETKYLQPIMQNKVLFKNHILEDDDISFYIKRISNEFMKKEIGYELAVKADLYNLLVSLLRKYISQSAYDKKVLLDKSYIKMNIVMKYIENNYMEDITIDNMAELAGFSKYYFCKLFKKLNGKTLSEYINRVRVIEALNLFRDTDMTITDVAMQVGFNDINYFSRTFKDVTGIRPSKIKKLVDLKQPK